MADETTPPDKKPAEMKPGDQSQPASDGKGQAQPERKFRVLHGAVSGVGVDGKGGRINRDYYAGQIVSESQLGNNTAHYIGMGAIEEA